GGGRFAGEAVEEGAGLVGDDAALDRHAVHDGAQGVRDGVGMFVVTFAVAAFEDQFFVEGEQEAGGVFAVEGGGGLDGGPTPAVAEFVFFREVDKGAGKGRRGGVGGEEPAVVAVLHDLANAGGVEGDDGVAGGHGLGEDEALGLGGGGKGELGHGGVGVVEAVAGEFAGEDDAFGDAGLLEDGDHVVAAGAVADDEGAGFGEGVEGLGDGAREEAEVFFGGEAAEVADDGDVGGDVPAFAGAGGFAGGDLAGVDAGGDDVDGDGDAARDDQFAHALAGGDDGGAAAGVAGGGLGCAVAAGRLSER